MSSTLSNIFKSFSFFCFLLVNKVQAIRNENGKQNLVSHVFVRPFSVFFLVQNFSVVFYVFYVVFFFAPVFRFPFDIWVHLSHTVVLSVAVKRLTDFRLSFWWKKKFWIYSLAFTGSVYVCVSASFECVALPSFYLVSCFFAFSFEMNFSTESSTPVKLILEWKKSELTIHLWTLSSVLTSCFLSPLDSKSLIKATTKTSNV